MSSSSKPAQAETRFIEGDKVVLARGPYTGTPGVFLHSIADTKWADIVWRNGGCLDSSTGVARPRRYRSGKAVTCGQIRARALHNQ